MRKVLASAVLLVVIAGIKYNYVPGLPVKEWNTPMQTPYVLYISGDGGLNNFSTGLCTTINKAGYGISAINAESYFQDKKTPEQTTKDITGYLEKIFRQRSNQQLVLAGYSFGADIVPFIVNRLPDSLKKKLISVIILSPGTSTDFETHWTDMLGWNKKRSMDVVAEINAMNVPKINTILGSDEKDFPVENITARNYTNEFLPGGHHFDNNTNEVAKTMLQYFK